jgi:hypothetical protein
MQSLCLYYFMTIIKEDLNYKEDYPKNLGHVLKVKRDARKLAENAKEAEIDETLASLCYELQVFERGHATKELNPFLTREEQKDKYDVWKKTQAKPKVATKGKGELTTKGRGQKRKSQLNKSMTVLSCSDK